MSLCLPLSPSPRLRVSPSPSQAGAGMVFPAALSGVHSVVQSGTIY